VDTRRIDWYNSQALQLHRVAMEGKGIGGWEGEDSLVPILQKKCKKFGMESRELSYSNSQSLKENEVLNTWQKVDISGGSHVSWTQARVQ
jgi:hypothetical protein